MRIRVFQSGKGDCLLLRSAADDHILIDGGLVSNREDFYSPNVTGTLASMRRRGIPLDLVCVSHMDQDHIGGILRMLNDEFEWRAYEHQKAQGILNLSKPENPRPPKIAEIWHNSFHEQVAMNRTEIEQAIAAAVPGSLALGLDRSAHGDNFFQDLATSMNEAARLSRRIGTKQLGIDLNKAFGGKLAMFKKSHSPHEIGAFKIRVIGPTDDQLDKLREDWIEWLESEKGKRQIERVNADSLEDEALLAQGDLNGYLAQRFGRAIGSRSSVTQSNVASILMYVNDGADDILLTGDARDDHILEGLAAAGLTDTKGHMHVKVLKLQHHGSKNNFSSAFAKRITADHYLLCGNGGHHNPQLDVLKTLIDSRLGTEEQMSPNQIGRKFKLWFSSSQDSAGADKDHMKEVEELVAARAAASNGQMSFHFSSGRYFTFSPR